MRKSFATRNLRIVALLLGAAPAGSLAAQGIPATAATQNVSPAQPLVQHPGVTASSEPEVHFSSGLLTVKAENSSLNKILVDISRATGMKITGGIGDEQVYGSYGPGKPQDVIAQLLDGTGSNVLLHENADHTVKELVLSARNGGATPPNPAAAAAREHEEMNQGPSLEERMRILQERRNAGLQQNQLRNHYGAGNPGDPNNPQQQLPQSPNGVRNPGQFGNAPNANPGSLPPESGTPPN